MINVPTLSPRESKKRKRTSDTGSQQLPIVSPTNDHHPQSQQHLSSPWSGMMIQGYYIPLSITPVTLEDCNGLKTGNIVPIIPCVESPTLLDMYMTACKQPYLVNGSYYCSSSLGSPNQDGSYTWTIEAVDNEDKSSKGEENNQEEEAVEALLNLSSSVPLTPVPRLICGDIYKPYPVLFQQCMNNPDVSNTFATIFQSKCSSNMIMNGRYIDCEGKECQHVPIRQCCGFAQYLDYLSDVFSSMPDALYMVEDGDNIIFGYDDDELIVASGFSFQGTYMEFKEKPLSTSTTVASLPTFSSVSSPLGISETSSLDDEDSLQDSYEWMITRNTSSSSLSSLTDGSDSPPCIHGQFVPYRSKELILPPDSCIESTKAHEVSVKGKIAFHINAETRLINCIDFTYQQNLSP